MRGTFYNRTLKRALLVTTELARIFGWIFLLAVMIYLTFATIVAAKGADLPERTVPLSQAQVWDGPAVVWKATTTGRHVIGLPGGDDLPINVVADAATPTPPTPTPTPTPTPDVPPGMTVRNLNSGIGSIRLASNTAFVSGTGRARITGSGVIVSSPNKVTNCLVKGVDFVSSSSATECVRIIADGLDGITFDDCTFTGGWNNVTFQGTNVNGPCTNRNITFRNCRYLDPLGNAETAGQNGFYDNIDGLTLDGCFGVNAGFKAPVRSIHVHFAYIAAGCKRVTVNECFIANPQAVGVQARGPLVRYTDADDGKDPGPTITNVVVYEGAIGVMVNGPRATVQGCSVFVGPHAKLKDNTGGESGVYASVGRFTLTDCTVVHSPVFDTGTMFQAIANGPRSDAAWGWNKPCNYALNARNVTNKAKVVSLDDLVVGLRGRGDVRAAVVEAKRRAQ